MMNDIILVPQPGTKETRQLQVSKPSPKKEALIITLPVEKRLPPPLKDFAVTKWTMPEEPQGYIHGNDNDCL